MDAGALPALIARSGLCRWFMLCFLHNGFGTSFASGTFTADVAAKVLWGLFLCCVCVLYPAWP
jgi:fluoride ion exporter CrcB/FEX